MLELNNLSPAPGSKKRRKRVGRGPSSGSGKTSGRGHKGQKARSGYSRRLDFEGGQMPITMRLPKRGFNQTAQHPVAEVNLDILERYFDDGDEVTAESLVKKHLIKKQKGGVKVLGRGELSKKLSVKVAKISGAARQKVEAAGGNVELIEPPVARQAARKADKNPKA